MGAHDWLVERVLARFDSGAAPTAWPAAAAITLGVALCLWCPWLFAAQGRDTPSLGRATASRCGGPYRWVRNPIYISALLVVLGEAWLYLSLPLLAYAGAMAISCHLFVTGYEEPTLRRRSGRVYEEYLGTVRRWIPHPSGTSLSQVLPDPVTSVAPRRSSPRGTTTEGDCHMSQAFPARRRLAAPRITAILAGILALGVVLEATFAGGFLGGHHVWMSWHEGLGNLLVLPPLASLIIGLALRRRERESASMLASRVALLILVIAVVATGHEGGNLLAVHIPAAVGTMGLVVRQSMPSSASADLPS